MKFQDILHGEHFNNLSSVIAVAFHAQPQPHADLYKRLKSEIPFWSLWKKFDKATPTEGDWNKSDVVDAFAKLLLSVTQAAPEILWYTEEDLKWFFEVLDSDLAGITISMFKAWISAPGHYLTPRQVAEITGMSESNWRNRAAGQPGYKPIPGCKKPGRDWLIPLNVLQSQGEVLWSYRPNMEAGPEEDAT